VDGYDAEILTGCTDSWRKTPRAIGEAMAETFQGDWVIAWRLKQLIAGGRAEGRGEGPFGLGEVRRAAARLMQV